MKVYKKFSYHQGFIKVYKIKLKFNSSSGSG